MLLGEPFKWMNPGIRKDSTYNCLISGPISDDKDFHQARDMGDCDADQRLNLIAQRCISLFEPAGSRH